MAVELQSEQVMNLIAQELSERARYRCLVLQAASMVSLDSLCECAIVAASKLGSEPKAMKYSEFFDEVGALSCNEIRETVEATAASHPVVIEGPLHFLDYWTEPTRCVFWRFLSTFSQGPGIIVVDTPRSDCIEGPFRVAGKLGDTDARYLKSRLAMS